MSTQIMIPDERAKQLDRLAKSQGITMAEAVGVLINLGIKANLLPDELPGYVVSRNGDKVRIEISDAFAKSFPLDVARGIASNLRAPMKTGVVTLTMLDMDAGLTIVRRGGGIKIKVHEHNVEKTMAPSVAFDLARLIDAAAG